MAQQQGNLSLPERQDLAEENEQDREERLHGILLRKMQDAADEVGRERICYALQISEGLLSKQLRGVDDKIGSYRLLAYLLKHEKSGRLGRWLVSDYAGYLPPQRPEKLEPAEAMRQVVALALAGDCSNGGREKILAIYEKMKGGPG